MAFSVQMPALGESVTEGTVTRWLKQEGEHVEVDEPLLEVSTDKVDTEIPSPAAGVLQRIVVQEDETVQVGAELAVIGDSAGGEADQPTAAATEGASGNGAVEEAPASDGAAAAAPAEPPDASPGDAEVASPEPAREPAAEPTPEAAPEPTPAAEAAPSSDGKDGTAITMPALGESVTEGTVTRWLKQVGDYVAIDEPLLEVSTDKVDTEIPSPVAGTLLEITAGEEQTVPVGGQLAVVSATSQSTAPPQIRPRRRPLPLPNPHPHPHPPRSEAKHPPHNPPHHLPTPSRRASRSRRPPPRPSHDRRPASSPNRPPPQHRRGPRRPPSPPSPTPRRRVTDRART